MRIRLRGRGPAMTDKPNDSNRDTAVLPGNLASPRMVRLLGELRTATPVQQLAIALEVTRAWDASVEMMCREDEAQTAMDEFTASGLRAIPPVPRKMVEAMPPADAKKVIGWITLARHIVDMRLNNLPLRIKSLHGIWEAMTPALRESCLRVANAMECVGGGTA